MLAAGLEPGMRVLDVGSGAGDVSMLAVDLVGPEGSVVGLDESSIAVETATARAAAAGLNNVAFIACKVETFEDPRLFDVIVGRYVLLFQADPAGFISSLKSKLRMGGRIAFHEIDDTTNFTARPEIELFSQINDDVMRALRTALPSPDVASRLCSVFKAAGLPAPELTCERLCSGGSASQIARWLALTRATIIERTRPSDAAETEELIQELDRALSACASQVASPDQWCAWSRVDLEKS
nr:methyltransferase domain-containing protein [Methylobacterium sp. ARG-1]